jgi:hypothetical protein
VAQAVALLWAALCLRHRRLAQGALLLLILAVGKFTLFDYETIFPSRSCAATLAGQASECSLRGLGHPVLRGAQLRSERRSSYLFLTLLSNNDIEIKVVSLSHYINIDVVFITNSRYYILLYSV